MEIDFYTYQDKVKGCWTGKNIGGTFGAPFEGKRQINNAEFYVQDLTEAPSNDDLDLQIVWLSAAERYGKFLNASILGEYWLSYILPNWVEYGTAKANLRAGLAPPLSGVVDNVYRNSCGCFIRSEIWACLAPGHPEISTKYAYEDAIVDHAEEGMLAEIFCAALQSAAFAESDPKRLIEIALSYIPQQSAVAKAVKTAQKCYMDGVSIPEARIQIHNSAPGTFGLQAIDPKNMQTGDNAKMDLGTPGFDAPENVAFVIAGWLYGEGDFGKSLIIANSFGEDTDCTCATLGALMGILQGDQNIPELWKAPLDDRISTSCIDKTSLGIWIPKNTGELTEKVIRTMPLFLGADFCGISSNLKICCASSLLCEKANTFLSGVAIQKKNEERPPINELFSLSPYITIHRFPFMTVLVDYDGSVYYQKDERRKMRIRVYNALYLN